MDPWVRMSAWLPPGLALGWLAVLASFVHGVASLLIAWGASVFLVVLAAALFASLRSRASSRSSSVSAGRPGGQQSHSPQAAPAPAPRTPLMSRLSLLMRRNARGARPPSQSAEL